MPNILLTNVCNRACRYCFALAQVQLGTARANWEMSEAELESVLGYLDPRFDPVSLLGGEPTLHSRFAPTVRELVRRGFDVKVFTNGTTAGLRQLEAELEAVTVILNLNPRSNYTTEAWTAIEANARHVGPRMRLSLNVDSADFSWDHALRAIEDWGLGRLVRLGIAQPIHGMSNRFLREEEMRVACVRIVHMAEQLAGAGISLGFDCGFRACAFTEEERGILAECGTHFLWGCRPVLDIGPSLVVWRCFPFSVEPGLQLTDYSSLAELTRAFEERWGAAACQGNLPECPSCSMLETTACRGGCLSRTLLASRAEAAHA